MRTLLLCIPAYNEAPIIADTVRAARAALDRLPEVDARILVVDNASTDGTAEAARAAGVAKADALVIEGKGKGRAVERGAKEARDSGCDLFGFVDADLSADPASLAELLAALDVGADIAIGSRLLGGAVERSWFRTLSSRIFNILRRLMLGLSVADTQCGLKLATKRGYALLLACEEPGWFFDVEWLAHAARQKLRIAEVPIHWREEVYAGRQSRLNVLSDGLAALAAFQRIRGRLRWSPEPVV